MNLVDVFSYETRLFCEPFPLKPWKHGEFAWATNGFILVALRSSGLECEETPDKYQKACAYLEEAPVDAVSVPLGDLAAFVGPVRPLEEKCSACGGSGYDDFETHECEHCGGVTRESCAECGGEKVTYPDARYVQIGPVTVNAAYLAAGLSFAGSTTSVLVGTVKGVAERSRGFHALMVSCDDWRVVLMSATEKVTKESDKFSLVRYEPAPSAAAEVSVD